MEFLDVCFNHIGDFGARLLSSCCHKVEKMSYYNCNFTSAGKKELKLAEKQKEKNYEIVDGISCEVGVEGGRLEVGGCVVEIPPNSLDQSTLIVLTSYYGSPQDEVSMSPILSCAPHDLKFLKPIKITLPTCFVTEDNNPAQVGIRHSEDGDEWTEFMTLMYRNDGCVSFETTHFTFWEAFQKSRGWLKKKKRKSIFISKKTLIAFQEAELTFQFYDSYVVQPDNDFLLEDSILIKPTQESLTIDFEIEDNNFFKVKPNCCTVLEVFMKPKFGTAMIIKKLKHDEQFSTLMRLCFNNFERQKKTNWFAISVAPSGQSIPSQLTGSPNVPKLTIKTNVEVNDQRQSNFQETNVKDSNVSHASIGSQSLSSSSASTSKTETSKENEDENKVLRKSFRFSKPKLNQNQKIVELDFEICDDAPSASAEFLCAESVKISSSMKNLTIKFEMENPENFEVEPSQLSFDVMSKTTARTLYIKKKTTKLPFETKLGFSISNLQDRQQPTWLPIRVPAPKTTSPYT